MYGIIEEIETFFTMQHTYWFFREFRGEKYGNGMHFVVPMNRSRTIVPINPVTVIPGKAWEGEGKAGKK